MAEVLATRAQGVRALPGPSVWLSLEEVLECTGWTEQWIRRLDAQGKVTSRPSGSHGRNGKPRREYLLSSLPAEAQIRWANIQAEKALVAARTSLTVPTAPEQANLAFETPAALGDGRTPLAQARLAAVEQILEYRKRPRAFRTADGRTIATLNAFIGWLGSQQNPPVSGRTVYRWWLDRFKPAMEKGANPYAALGKRDRSDKDKSKFFAQHPAAAAWVILKFTAERITNLHLLHEALCRKWTEFSGSGCQPPSYATLRAFIDKEVSAPLRTYAHQGAEAYEHQHAPFIVRDRASIAPMDWWVLDHRTLDIGCRNTIFPTLERDAIFRLDFTGIVDWGSRSWVGFCLSPQGSWRTVGSALRMAISDYGFPKNLYWDNGEDFKKVQRMLSGASRGSAEAASTETDADEFAQAMRVFLKGAGIEIGITRALKYNPGAKMIEAMFSGVRKRFDIIWGDAYQGSSPAERSEYNEIAQRRHKVLAARAQREGGHVGAVSPFPADVEVIAALGQWLYRENSMQRKSLDGGTRLGLLEAAAKQNPQPPVPRRLLDVLFSERDTRMVDRGACIRLDNRRYEPATDADRVALDRYQEEKIVVLRDPYCLEEAVALDPESLKVVAEMRLQDFVAQCPNGHVTRDQIQAGLRLRRQFKRMYANYVGFFAAMASSQGWKTEREVLLEEAGVVVSPAVAAAAPAASAPARAAVAKPELAPAFVSDLPALDLSNLELEE